MMQNAIAISLLALVGCLGTGKPDDPVIWPGLVECVPTEPILALVADVTDNLLSGDGLEISDEGRREFEDLARKHTPDAVACAVELALQGFSRQAAAGDADMMSAGIRGRDFLQDVGTRVIIEPAQ